MNYIYLYTYSVLNDNTTYSTQYIHTFDVCISLTIMNDIFIYILKKI